MVTCLCTFAGPVEGPQDEQQPTEEDTRQNLAFLLEKVEGCSVSMLAFNCNHTNKRSVRVQVRGKYARRGAGEIPFNRTP